MEHSNVYVSEKGKLCLDMGYTVYEIVGLISYDRFKLVATT